MWKRKKIVLLPTKGFSPLYKEEDGRLAFDEMLHSYGGVAHFHLYVLDYDKDNKIESGDWYLNSIGNICQLGEDHWEISHVIEQKYPKVIASTDKMLKFGEDVPGIIQYKFLPSIPLSFIIDTYIKKHNKCWLVDDLDVEYDCKCTIPFSESAPERDRAYIDELIVNGDNTISIRPIGRLKEMIDKDDDLREELRMYCSTAFFAGRGNGSLDLIDAIKVHDEWMHDNIDTKE